MWKHPAEELGILEKPISLLQQWIINNETCTSAFAMPQALVHRVSQKHDQRHHVGKARCEVIVAFYCAIQIDKMIVCQKGNT